MTKPKIDSSFTTDVAEFYESTLVPPIFRSYARDLAERTKGLVLVTRALAEAPVPQAIRGC